MITVWGERTEANGHWPPCENCPPRHQKTIGEALASLAEYELGFGGRATDITETENGVRVEITTRLLSKIDKMWFEGSVKEMTPLLRVIAMHSGLLAHNKHEIVQASLTKIDALLGDLKGNPMYLTMSVPLIMGGLSVKVVLLSVLGVNSEDELNKYKAHSIKDLCAAWELSDYTTKGMDALL